MKTTGTIGMSLALATLIVLGTTGCGSDGDSTPAVGSTAVDITVERGKVYDATVTDSATPQQVATQKSGKNVYTFVKAPVYPVKVNGGWIDVNGNGKLDPTDVKLDIEMKSYSTTVTPLTTAIASASTKKERDLMLQELADELNVAGVGSDTQVTLADLLKVPSEAPRDVMVAANAIFKDMKEKNTSKPELTAVMSQFNTLYSKDATALSIESEVIANLISQGVIGNVSADYILKYGDKVVTPPTGGDKEVVTPPTGGDKEVPNGYKNVFIYKNLTSQEAEIFLNLNNYETGLKIEYTSSTTSCTDFGFTFASEAITQQTFIKESGATCAESDSSKIPGKPSGTTNIISYNNN